MYGNSNIYVNKRVSVQTASKVTIVIEQDEVTINGGVTPIEGTLDLGTTRIERVGNNVYNVYLPYGYVTVRGNGVYEDIYMYGTTGTKGDYSGLCTKNIGPNPPTPTKRRPLTVQQFAETCMYCC